MESAHFGRELSAAPAAGAALGQRAAAGFRPASEAITDAPSVATTTPSVTPIGISIHPEISI